MHLLQTFKLEQTQTQSQEKQYIREYPLASRGLCPNSILKQLHLAIHHEDSNLSLLPHTAVDLPSSQTQAPAYTLMHRGVLECLEIQHDATKSNKMCLILI